jgi:hypothetical protein
MQLTHLVARRVVICTLAALLGSCGVTPGNLPDVITAVDGSADSSDDSADLSSDDSADSSSDGSADSSSDESPVEITPEFCAQTCAVVTQVACAYGPTMEDCVARCLEMAAICTQETKAYYGCVVANGPASLFCDEAQQSLVTRQGGPCTEEDGALGFCLSM